MAEKYEEKQPFITCRDQHVINGNKNYTVIKGPLSSTHYNYS